jgi:hyaluronate lyase
VGVISVAAAVSGTFGGRSFAHATPADFAALRTRWVDQLTGRTVIDADDADFRTAIAALDRGAATAIALLDKDPDRTAVFTDLDYTRDPDVVTTYTRLAQIATAWATPGSTYAGDAAVLQQVLAGLDDANRLIYNDQQGEFGNWWSWEIGASKALADTMALVADHLPADRLAAYCAAIDHFVPDPWQMFPPARAIVSTGANRVDLCQAVIIRSIVGGDAARLDHAVAGLPVVWEQVSTGDGFYADGSFIQHTHVPYIGTYGTVLLHGLAELFALLAGSAHTIDAGSVQTLYDAVDDAFAPFVFDGEMNEAVRGRAVSRSQERGFDDGRTCIVYTLRLAQAVDPATARRWRAMCRGWIERNHTDPIIGHLSVPQLAIVKDLLGSDVTASPEPTGPRLFPAMARAVHRGPDWSVSLGMDSRTISWYECGNGENDLGYHTGDGVTYLSVRADQDHFDNDFWPTVDLDRLPGTTVDTTPLPPKVEGEWTPTCPQNDWTGGAALDDVAVVGQHVIGPGGTGLSARKMWFLAHDRIVALGSGITTGTGAPVQTVIENRNLGRNDRRLIVDGRPATGAGVDQPGWAHLQGVAGYVFLDVDRLTAQVTGRTGSWSKINTGGPTAELSNDYATLIAEHGTDPDDARYAYVVLPTADRRVTEREAADPRTVVLANSAQLQIVRTGADTAVCCWAAAEAAGIGLDGPAAAVLRHRGNRLQVSVADPTGTRDQVVLTVRGRYAAVQGAGATLRFAEGRTTVTVDTTGRQGRSVGFTLVR